MCRFYLPPKKACFLFTKSGVQAVLFFFQKINGHFCIGKVTDEIWSLIKTCTYFWRIAVWQHFKLYSNKGLQNWDFIMHYFVPLPTFAHYISSPQVDNTSRSICFRVPFLNLMRKKHCLWDDDREGKGGVVLSVGYSHFVRNWHRFWPFWSQICHKYWYIKCFGTEEEKLLQWCLAKQNKCD